MGAQVARGADGSTETPREARRQSPTGVEERGAYARGVPGNLGDIAGVHLEVPGAEQNKQVVRDHVAAFDSGDLARLVSLFSKDAEVQGVLGRGVIEKVLPFWRQLVEGYGMQLAIEEIISPTIPMKCCEVVRRVSSGTPFSSSPSSVLLCTVRHGNSVASCNT